MTVPGVAKRMRWLVLCLTVCLLVGPDRPESVPPSAGFLIPPTTGAAPVVPSDGPLPTPAEFAELAKADVLAALRAGIRRYRREVRGFTAVLQKQERIGRRLNPVETLEVAYRNEPHSVLLK